MHTYLLLACTGPRTSFSSFSRSPARKWGHGRAVIRHVSHEETKRELTSSRSVNSYMAFLLPRDCNKHTEDYSSHLNFQGSNFLGFALNIITMTVALSTTKMNRIQSDVVAKVVRNKTVCLEVLCQPLGKLVATSQQCSGHYYTVDCFSI